MGKNIIILADGTGQKGGEEYNSNIYKIFNTIENRTDNQIIFYDPGIGTRGIEIIKQISGYGISQNIKDCYRFLFENFQAGDDIFLFGFSRGAATVRSLSSFIHYFGILPKSRQDLIDEAYKIYKINNNKKRNAQAEAFIDKHHTMWTRIKFLGCFDTVSALGLPIKGISPILDRIPFFRHNFHNYKLSKSVEHAYHALAIDDERKTFHPKLWDSTVEEYQTLQQVWFPGMHTDIGGGYKKDDLSNIPFLWMCRKAMEHGLRIYNADNLDITPQADAFMHNSRSGWWQQLIYTKKERRWPNERSDQPIIHECVAKRAEKKDYRPWILSTDYDIEPYENM